MPRILNARLPLRVEQKLAQYCAKHAVTRTEVTVRALDAYFDTQRSRVDGYALAEDLIPKRGARKLQSSAIRKLARDAFRGSRSR
jgi:hypothetical protein